LLPVKFYMDVNAKGAITRGLRIRGVDVLTAQEDGQDETPDEELLDRAAELRRIIFTHYDDFLAEAQQRQKDGRYFTGVIYIHERDVRIGRCVDDLETIAYASGLEEYADQVKYLPL